ncbi:MAG TPA: hypothetical protein DIC52_25920 [Candidatus Latescibacteria bacterium]|nr:hypothetical protein [Candidatus Latescibacterota bacterium]
MWSEPHLNIHRSNCPQWGETKATHPPIVSTRLWNRCNQMLSGKR